MSKFEDRLRRELPALADALREARSVRSREPSDAALGPLGDVAEFEPQPDVAARRRRWPKLVAAAAALIAVAALGAFLLDRTDGTDVTTTDRAITESAEGPDGRADGEDDPDGTGSGMGMGDSGRPEAGDSPGVGLSPEAGDTPRGERVGGDEPSVPVDEQVLDELLAPSLEGGGVLSTSGEHTCALQVDRRIGCWGANEHGQSDAPGGEFVMVAVGESHSCGLRADQSVSCWGSSEHGQAGAPGGEFTAVSSGSRHSCGLRADQSVACWGSNEHGQIEGPDGRFAAVSAGEKHTCGLRLDGTASCWGSSEHGQAGAPGGEFTAVSSGSRHSCGLRADQSVACWGSSEHGLPDAPGGEFNSIAAGQSHACAIRSDGGMTCWGKNWYGEADAPDGSFLAVSAGTDHTCGLRANGSISCWGRDHDAPTGAPDGRFTTITSGVGHVCGLQVDGTILCWGDNTYGQAAVPGGRFSAVSAGSEHTCGLRVDGTIECWGAHLEGQLAAPSAPFSAVSAGGFHTCGLRADSTIACWGNNADGQADAPDGLFRSVSAGDLHTCGLRTDGTVDCWGWNEASQADPPDGEFIAVSAADSHTCGVQPVRLALIGPVVCWGSNWSGEGDPPDAHFVSVTAGGSHSCGRRADGTVACWGSGGMTGAPAGQLTAVAAGRFHTCGLRPDGAAICWGEPVPEVRLGPAPSEPTVREPEPAVAEPEPEPAPEPEPEPESNDGSQQGGDGRVVAGRANWSSGYFQASLFKLLLEELGYEVTDPAQLEMGPNNAYIAMAQGDMDYWPNSWYPVHYALHLAELPDGSLIEDHVTVVGEQLIAGGLQGFLVTKSFADTYGVYTLDDLNRDARALAAFDDADPVPGNGKADIFGCMENWTCDDIIENMIAFSGWDNIVQIRAGYDAMFEQARRRVNNGDPMVFYTWTPSLYITQLRPGENVYWMGMDRILDDSNPANQERGEEHDQRGVDGTGGRAAVSSDQCPSAADQPDGKCPTGWIAVDILVTANTEFLRANPRARALFEAVKLTVAEVSEANLTQQLGDHPDDVAARWIADNRDRVDQWLAAARAAAASS